MTGGGPFDTAVYPPFSPLLCRRDLRPISSFHALYPPTSKTGLRCNARRNSFSKMIENRVPGAVEGAPGLGKAVDEVS